MMPSLDLADLIAYAQAHSRKVVLAGTARQLQAVEDSGGMSLVAAALGCAGSPEAGSGSTPAWERGRPASAGRGFHVLAECGRRARCIAGVQSRMMTTHPPPPTSALDLRAPSARCLIATDHALRAGCCTTSSSTKDLITSAVAFRPAPQYASPRSQAPRRHLSRLRDGVGVVLFVEAAGAGSLHQSHELEISRCVDAASAAWPCQLPDQAPGSLDAASATSTRRLA